MFKVKTTRQVVAQFIFFNSQKQPRLEERICLKETTKHKLRQTKIKTTDYITRQKRQKLDSLTIRKEY